MDVEDLSARASARCGIRIEPHDPAFVLITLNQLVLEETVAAICAQVETRIASFAESIQNVERLAGKTLAQEVRASGIEVRRGIHDDVKQASWQARELIVQISRSSSRPTLIRWAAIGVVGAVLMFVFGVCFDWYIPFNRFTLRCCHAAFVFTVKCNRPENFRTIFDFSERCSSLWLLLFDPTLTNDVDKTLSTDRTSH